MTETKDEATILIKIEHTYVPFLRKIIAFLETTKKVSHENLSKLKAIYAIFTTASSHEKIEAFHVNQTKLESWYNKLEKSKHPFISSDTESSQGESKIIQPSTERMFTFADVIISGTSDNINKCSISSTKLTQVDANLPVHVSQIKEEEIAVIGDPKINQSRACAINSELLSVHQILPDRVLTPLSTDTHTPVSPLSEEKPVTFKCASCQFQTEDESDFIKHSRVNHKTDLSVWCKQCEKCFINPEVLVSHIKERACVKEDMFYKCGEKSCGFETTKGQTFIEHLRHCHKRSPFIFCVHCQKIYTLPHCLVLHMQDDCPFKDKNRKSLYNGNKQPETYQQPNPTYSPYLLKSKIASSVKILYVASITQQEESISNPVITISTPHSSILSPFYGPERSVVGKGREKCDSEMPKNNDLSNLDNPLCHSEMSVDETGLSHSDNISKKISVTNPEIPCNITQTSTSVKVWDFDEKNLKMINCPCCDVFVGSQIDLENHYITVHKHVGKNTCLICCLKFENIRSFFDHFEEHRKGVLPNKQAHIVNKVGLKETSKQSDKLPPNVMIEVGQKEAPEQINRQPHDVVNEVRLKEMAKQVNLPETSVTSKVVNINGHTENLEKICFDKVLISIVDANLGEPSIHESLAVPYQAAIHDDSQRDSKFKSFEDLKTSSALTSMKNIKKLKHFFKCGFNNCVFTTDVINEFSSHLKIKHMNKIYHCCYCLKEEVSSDTLVKHIAFKHKNRIYQCSKCFYRASSKYHAQIHIKTFHTPDSLAFIFLCNLVELPSNVNLEEVESVESVKTVWPYICAIGKCYFSTYDPKQFKRHNETVHITATEFYCQYCKVDFLLLKRLMNHYRLHGLNLFQCNNCIHGAETKEEILLHLCNVHPDEPLKVYMRASQEEVAAEVKHLNSIMHKTCKGKHLILECLTETSSSKKAVDNKPKNIKIDKMYTGCENELYHVIDNRCYPSYLHSICFPRYLKNFLSDIICGVPFCNEKLPDISFYVSHLNDAHKALNFPCPYCPEMYDSWTDFKNHFLCHGSKLYACGSKGCEFYDWNKQKVKVHKKEHKDANYSIFSVREFAEGEDESKLKSLVLNTEFPDVKDIFVCLFCKYKTSDRNVMKNHLYREMAYQRFGCSLCDKRCLSRKEIKDHFIISHPDLDIMCSQDSNTEIETVVKLIMMHQQKFENVKLAESCNECNRKFRNSLQLQCHLYICLQKKYRPYECHLCKKSYVNLLALKYHTDKEHHPKSIEYSFISSYIIEEIVEKKLLEIRLNLLKNICKENELNIDYNEVLYMLKFYACTGCSFQAYHKFNVERHITQNHAGNAKIMKKYESSFSSCGKLNSLNGNLYDSTCNEHLIKRYWCGYCASKMFTVREVESHINRAHTVENSEYFYFYNPDINTEFSCDKNIYTCAYCMLSKGNLFFLKKHSESAHLGLEFKVKGFISCSQPQNDYSACGYCFVRVESQSELQEHSASLHPVMSLKSVGSFKINKRLSESDDLPNKRVKFGCTVFICSHCGATFSSTDQMTSHFRKAHRHLKVEYTKKLDQLSNIVESDNLKFYKCEFCRFISERQFLDQHLATKHKMSVICSYCKQCFEFASKLKEHHVIAHKNLPIKYRQETVKKHVTYSRALNRTNRSNKNYTIPKLISHYGAKSEPIDLNSLIVNMKTSDGQSVQLPLQYVTEQFDIFPKLVLKDVMKK